MDNNKDIEKKMEEDLIKESENMNKEYFDEVKEIDKIALKEVEDMNNEYTNENEINFAATLQEKYVDVYNKVESEIVDKGYAKTLFELCSVIRNEKEIKLEFLLNDISTIEAKTALKKSFDKYALEYGFKMNYTNLIGDLY